MALSLLGVFLSFVPQAQALQISNYPGFLNIRLGMSLTELVSMFFNFLLIIAGLAAFAMIVWGGINYLTSAGDPSRTGDAKDQIFKAILGLVVMFASWMILNTINPQLVELKEPDTPTAKPAESQTTPVIVGNCVAGTDYDVKLYPQKNYQPTETPLNCFNSGESIDKRASSAYVYSVGIQVATGAAIRIFDSNLFQGRNICFTRSYTDLNLCHRGGWMNIDVWPDNVRSVKIISANECQNPGTTLGENGTPSGPDAKCDGF